MAGTSKKKSCRLYELPYVIHHKIDQMKQNTISNAGRIFTQCIIKKRKHWIPVNFQPLF